MAEIAFAIQNHSIALASIIAPIAVIYFLDCGVVHATTAIPFAIKVLPIVDIAGNMVEHASPSSFFIIFPTAFIYGAIQVDDLAVAFPCESFVLAHVDVAICVQ